MIDILEFFRWLETVNVWGDQWNIIAVVLLLFCLVFATYKLFPIFIVQAPTLSALFLSTAFGILFVVTLLCLSDASNWLIAPWASQPLKTLDILTVEFFGCGSVLILTKLFKDFLQITRITWAMLAFFPLIKLPILAYLKVADYRLITDITAQTEFFVVLYVIPYIILTVLFTSIWKPIERCTV